LEAERTGGRTALIVDLGSLTSDLMIYEVIATKKAGDKTGDEIGGRSHRLELGKTAEGWACRFDGQPVHIDAVITRRDVLSLLIDGRAYEIKREQTTTGLHMWVGSTCFAVELRDPRSLRSRQKAAGDEKGPRKIMAPMPGRIVRLLVAENSDVEAGQAIVVVEAMKMQNEIKSPKKGVVKIISTAVGATVNPGDILAIVE
jgi:biotin carboxyl carrier protein